MVKSSLPQKLLLVNLSDIINPPKFYHLPKFSFLKTLAGKDKILAGKPMLAIQKQQKYFQKAVQLPNGEWALLVFELVERNGQIIAKAVSGKILGEEIVTEEILCLPCVKSPVEFIPIKSVFSNIVLNFVKDFSFMTCLVTRAPNF